LAPATFLAAHPLLEVLHLDINIHGGGFTNPGCLPAGSVPRLREIKASKEVINAILECPCDTRRPLEVIKGFKLSGHHSSSATNQIASSRSIPDATFLSNLKGYSSTVRKVELAGWHDMEDIRKLTPCIPNVQHLDIGRRLGAAAQRSASMNAAAFGGPTTSGGSSSGPAANIIEWTELLATLPELTTLHGVKFFYEVTSAPIGSSSSSSSSSLSLSTTADSPQPQTLQNQSSMSMMERSRMRKNDEIASVLAWKCKKLRRVDHWEESGAKVVVLVRDHRDHGHGDDGAAAGGKDKVRWEVRRVKI